MTTYVLGIRNLEESFQKMLKVKQACEEAGIEYPPAVRKYFKQHTEEAEEVIRSHMETVDISDAFKETDNEYSQSFEVDLTQLPSEVKRIRFVNIY
jgi:hypothetical protein